MKIFINLEGSIGKPKKIMGTNYYGKRIPTQEQLENIAQKVLQGELDVVKIMLEPFEEIHIGKSSSGWRFLFDHNNAPWETFEEYKKWISEFQIYSEYGVQNSQKEFWDMVEKTQKNKSAIEQIQNLSWYHIIDGYEFSSATNFS